VVVATPERRAVSDMHFISVMVEFGYCVCFALALCFVFCSKNERAGEKNFRSGPRHSVNAGIVQ